MLLFDMRSRFLLNLDHVIFMSRVDQHRRQWRKLEQVHLAFGSTGQVGVERTLFHHVNIASRCHGWWSSYKLMPYLAHICSMTKSLCTFLNRF
jgi:hypothetical protein